MGRSHCKRPLPWQRDPPADALRQFLRREFRHSLAQRLSPVWRKRRDAAYSHVDMQRHQLLHGGTLAALGVEHLMEIVHPLAVGTQQPTSNGQSVAEMNF